MRSDLNVPLDDDGNITDPGRIIASVPTLKKLADAGAKVVVTAHLGRPKDGPTPEFSLAPVAKALGEKLDGTSSWPAMSSAPTRWPVPKA